MPYKHQTESYRTRDGIRFVCDADVCDQAHGDLRSQAAERVSVLRSEGLRAFFEKLADGGYRVFVQQ